MYKIVLLVEKVPGHDSQVRQGTKQEEFLVEQCAPGIFDKRWYTVEGAESYVLDELGDGSVTEEALVEHGYLKIADETTGQIVSGQSIWLGAV